MFNLAAFMDTHVDMYKGMTIHGSVRMWDNHNQYTIVSANKVMLCIMRGYKLYGNKHLMYPTRQGV